MINIRGATEGDRIIYLKSNVDNFLREKEIYDVPNDVLLKEKRKYEVEFANRLKDIFVITCDGELCGTFTVYKYEDGHVLDRIALVSEFDNEDIKSFVIKYVKAENKDILYAIIPHGDIDIYKENGFSIVGKNETLYKLKIINN